MCQSRCVWMQRGSWEWEKGSPHSCTMIPSETFKPAHAILARAGKSLRILWGPMLSTVGYFQCGKLGPPADLESLRAGCHTPRDRKPGASHKCLKLQHFNISPTFLESQPHHWKVTKTKFFGKSWWKGQEFEHLLGFWHFSLSCVFLVCLSLSRSFSHVPFSSTSWWLSPIDSPLNLKNLIP